jgi:hypothetical protein
VNYPHLNRARYHIIGFVPLALPPDERVKGVMVMQPGATSLCPMLDNTTYYEMFVFSYSS